MNIPYSKPSNAATWTPMEKAIDVAIALGAFAAMLAIIFSGGVGGSSDTDGDFLAVVLAALSTWPLVLRRWNPFAVFVFTITASTVMYGLRDPEGPPIGPTIALYFVGAAPDEQRPNVWVVVAVATILMIVHTAGNAFAEFTLGLALWSAAWFAGDRTRLWRERIADLEQRAIRAEEASERERRLAVAEERTRIARDLHDSAAHAINVILVQTGAARLLHDRDPGGSRAALETVEEVARETLGDIDRIVRALRDGADREHGSTEVEPPVGLAALQTLAARHESAGMAVDVRVRGREKPLSRGVDQAAFRILQEALTNAARHGRDRTAVEVRFRKKELDICVTNRVNPTIPRAAQGGAHGLIGMRERAALIGGKVDASANNGQFRVHAVLPYADGNGA
jgi:signal transduction histidine kinase